MKTISLKAILRLNNKALLKSMLFIMPYFFSSCASETFQSPEHNPYGLSYLYPEDNPFDAEKAALGKRLFFDTRLSINHTVSCATCHQPDRAFTDGEPKAKGVFDRRAKRNSPTLFNVAFGPYFMTEGGPKTLEMQALAPIQEHTEMAHNLVDISQELRKDSVLNALSKRIFQREIDPFVITRSLGAFQRTLLSFDSPYDEFILDGSPLPDKAMKGYRLFSDSLGCISCHAPPLFTTYGFEKNTRITDSSDLGRYVLTYDEADKGLYKTPTLRNIALTSPYMHDGRYATLSEVIQHYKENFPQEILSDYPKTIASLNAQESSYLLSFLYSLTGKQAENATCDE